MQHIQKVIFALRVGLGWIFLYAGLSHLLSPGWSAAGYLKSAQTLSGLFQWLASPGVLPTTNALACWGLTLVGFSLVFGALVRLSSIFGMALMFLFYLPILSFPYVGANSFLIDDHIIYLIIFILLFESRAGRFWGFDAWSEHLAIWKKYPHLRDIIS